MWCKNEDGTAKLDAHGWSMRSRAFEAGQPIIRWERASDPRLSDPSDAGLHQQTRPMSLKETALHSAILARDAQDCGCGYYDYRSDSCGHLGVRYPIMCGTTTDEKGIARFCEASLESDGDMRKIKAEAPVEAKCRACNGVSTKIILWDSIPSPGVISIGEQERGTRRLG